ncbi:MAG: hypothetical protein IJ636_08260, partial [Bacteroidales bacterium]|nr:hypothetical protein [Bacteroidales bacterium]
LFLVTALLSAGCYDEQLKKLDDLEDRVDELTLLCSKLNQDLEALQSLVRVIESQDMITGITEIRSGTTVTGYRINFVKHDPVTIINGSNGQVPIVSSRENSEDGNYYWSVQYGNDEWDWLKAPDGSMMLAIGVLPQVSIRNGWFCVTTDGKTWTQLGRADGEGGDQMFHSVSRYEDYVIIRLNNGQVLQIPTYSAFLALKDEIEKVNQNASAQKELVDTHRQRLRWISNIQPIITNGDTTGQTISLSTGRSVSIHDWTSSLSPAIFIKKHSDGQFYWAYSMNNSGDMWVLSPEGEKIPAESEQAEVPQLSVTRDSDGEYYWTITTAKGAEFLRTRVSGQWVPQAIDSVTRIFSAVRNYPDSLVVLLKDNTKFVLPKQYSVSFTDTLGVRIDGRLSMEPNAETTILYQANGPDVGLTLIPQGGFTADHRTRANGSPCIVLRSPGSFTEDSGKIMAVFTFATSTAPMTVIKTFTITPK